MGTFKNLLTASMVFFILTMFFACEKGNDFTATDIEMVEVQETLIEESGDGFKTENESTNIAKGSTNCGSIVYLKPHFTSLAKGGTAIHFSMLQGYPLGTLIVGATWHIEGGELSSNTNSIELIPGVTYTLKVEGEVTDANWEPGTGNKGVMLHQMTLEFTLDEGAVQPYTESSFHISEEDIIQCTVSGGGGGLYTTLGAGWG